MGLRFWISSIGAVWGSSSLNTPHSRTRRAISWLYWPPKSRTRTSSCAAAVACGSTASASSAGDRRDGGGPLHYSTSAASGCAGAPPLVTPSDAGAALAADWAPMPMAWSRWSCLPSVCSDGATMTSARWNEGMSS